MTRSEDAHQVERVGAVDGHQCAVGLFAADGADLLDGLRQGVLLSGESVDEASAADFAPGFKAPVGAEEVPPRRQAWLPHQELMKNHAVATQELAGDELGLLGGVEGVLRGVVEYGPASGSQVLGWERAYAIRPYTGLPCGGVGPAGAWPPLLTADG